jgi:hypothetical protein
MSIQSDDTATGLSDADAIAALTGALTGKGKPQASEEEADEDEEDLEEEDLDEADPQDADDDDEGDEEDTDDEDEDGDDDADDEDEGAAGSPAAAADDAVVKVVVDGVEQELTVGSLKRLAGQEAALTRKSQEADLVGRRAAATIQGALEVVLEDLQAYADVDWVLEGARMDPEELAWHRQQYQTLIARRDKLVAGAKDLDRTLEARQQARLQQEAVEAVKVLSDPQQGIPGWSEELYGEILDFAIEAGLPEDDVVTITNPAVIKIINDARMFHKGQKAAAQKVNLTPKRVRRGGGDEPIRSSEDKTQKAVMKKLRSGRATDEDAMQALLGRWGVKGR